MSNGGRRIGTPRPGGRAADESGSAGPAFKVYVVMTPNTPQQDTTRTEAPAFPHHAAAAQTPLEAAERQYADRPSGVPNWQPEDGDFT
jgi:hypothetical protein